MVELVDMVPLGWWRKVKPSPGPFNTYLPLMHSLHDSKLTVGGRQSLGASPILPPLGHLGATVDRCSIRSVSCLPKPDDTGPWLFDLRRADQIHEPTIHPFMPPQPCWTCPEAVSKSVCLQMPRRLRWSCASARSLPSSVPRCLPAKQYNRPSFQLSMSSSCINRARSNSGRYSSGSGVRSAEKGVPSAGYGVATTPSNIGSYWPRAGQAMARLAEGWCCCYLLTVREDSVLSTVSKFSPKVSNGSPLDPRTLADGGHRSAICPSGCGSWRSLALPVACLAYLAGLGFLGAQSMKHRKNIDKFKARRGWTVTRLAWRWFSTCHCMSPAA